MNNIHMVNKYGRWAVITGASNGIGRAFAYELAAEGFNLLLVARQQTVLFELALELEQKFGVDAVELALDFSISGAHEKLIRASEELDVGLFVASAGFGTSGRFTDSNLENELAMIDVNCRAVTEQTHYFSRKFAANKKGGIILLSSIVAFQGVPLSSGYAASKAYIQTLAEGLHYELKPFSVDVLAVAPGPVKSGFSERANLFPTKTESPEVVARQSIIALGRKVTIRPGFLAKLLGALLNVPRMFRIKIMQQVMVGMTKPKRRHGSIE